MTQWRKVLIWTCLLYSYLIAELRVEAFTVSVSRGTTASATDPAAGVSSAGSSSIAGSRVLGNGMLFADTAAMTGAAPGGLFITATPPSTGLFSPPPYFTPASTEILHDPQYYLDDTEEDWPSVLELYRTHTGHMSDKWKNYLYLYDDIFPRIRREGYLQQRAIRLMEIGVFNGGSLDIWKQYFHVPGMKLPHIIGVDINPNTTKITVSEGVQIVIMNACNVTLAQDFIQHLKEKDQEEFVTVTPSMAMSNTPYSDLWKQGVLDILLDDGSHLISDVIDAFDLYFPHVRPGGTYIIEDTHTSYFDLYYGIDSSEGYNVVNYFRNMLQCLYFSPEEDKTSQSNDSEGFCEEEQVARHLPWIRSIYFDDSVIVIRKNRMSRQKPYPKIAHEPRWMYSLEGV